MTSAEPGRKAPYSSDIRWRVVRQGDRYGAPLQGHCQKSLLVVRYDA